MPNRSEMDSLSRRQFSKICFAGVAASTTSQGFTRCIKARAAQVGVATSKPPAFKLRGIYFHDGFEVEPRRLAPLYWRAEQWRRQIDWLAACGINAVEFATMLEFNRIPSTEFENNKIADRLKILSLAHQRGLKFGYILSNTVVSTVPNGEEPGNQLRDRAIQLCPRVNDNFERTINLQSWYINTYKDADFFEEFAADWGGCFCGTCNVNQYLRYVRELADQVDSRNHSAPLYANTWCISYWGPNPIPQGWRHVFEKESLGSKEVIDAIPSLPSNVHLTLPCHNLYRQLVFESFGGKEKTPVFPREQDLLKVRQAGRHVLAWPHFVVDDDVGRLPQWGVVHSEVRYIRAMLMRLQEAKIDQVIGNLYVPNLQLSNAYAFGRLTDRPDIASEEVLNDFAKLVAQPADVTALTAVLCWLENNSYWHHQLPVDAREAPLQCELTRSTAISTLKRVRPRGLSDLPLPVPAAQWLEDLQASLLRMNWAS